MLRLCIFWSIGKKIVHNSMISIFAWVVMIGGVAFGVVVIVGYLLGWYKVSQSTDDDENEITGDDSKNDNDKIPDTNDLPRLNCPV